MSSGDRIFLWIALNLVSWSLLFAQIRVSIVYQKNAFASSWPDLVNIGRWLILVLFLLKLLLLVLLDQDWRGSRVLFSPPKLTHNGF
jgi:hypothetical protein